MNAHHDQDIEWDVLGVHREREAGLHAPALAQAMDWLRDLLRTNGGGCTPVHRVLDIGSGPGWSRVCWHTLFRTPRLSLSTSRPASWRGSARARWRKE